MEEARRSRDFHDSDWQARPASASGAQCHATARTLHAALLFGALVSLVRKASRSSLYTKVKKGGARDKLDKLTWRQFEGLIQEYFHRNGYTVSETDEGPDGGIDLNLRKNGRTATVQCKHWRNKKVDVKVVREQLGVMTASRADECFVVTTGEFTGDAREFAENQPITLIDGKKLGRLMGIFSWDHVEAQATGRSISPSCPNCQADMVLRKARRGRNAGSEFRGCSRYPKCRGTTTLR